MVYVVVGFMAVYASIAGTTDSLLQSYAARIQRRYRHEDAETLPPDDRDVDRGLRAKRVFFVVLMLGLQLCGGVAMCFIEEWSYLSGIWWAFETTATVG